MFWKAQGYLCPLARNAVQVHACLVDFGGMLDDGKAQPGSADFFGMAFVNTVEAFKNMLLV